MPSDQPRVPDSERATTTAARRETLVAVIRKAVLADLSLAEMQRDAPCRDHAEAVADALEQWRHDLRPLVVREEHDRLRSQIEALPTWRNMADVSEFKKVVLALFGESTQEQAGD